MSDKRFVVCIAAEAEFKHRLLTMVEACFGHEFDYRLEESGENALRWLEKTVLSGKDAAMIFVDQRLADGRGDLLLAKLFEKRPNALLTLFAEKDDNVMESALEAAKAYRLIHRPLSDAELKNALREALRHYRQRLELTEKSRILTELNRASLSLIGEINLQKLLHKLMRIMVDNAAAADAFIILEGENGPTIEAEGRSGDYETKFESRDVSDFSPVCPAVVEYCRATKETLILGDALNEGLFSAHPYIRKNACRSILCAPLVYQGKLFGFIYLDNREKTYAFNAHNLELFRLLSAPAAIAI
ncbi:MAG: GAF domain-containing protein, partial [Bacteroidia bacterium]|nr:GAF domain-containing protein [Bacteroidia bacterium]